MSTTHLGRRMTKKEEKERKTIMVTRIPRLTTALLLAGAIAASGFATRTPATLAAPSSAPTISATLTGHGLMVKGAQFEPSGRVHLALIKSTTWTTLSAATTQAEPATRCSLPQFAYCRQPNPSAGTIRVKLAMRTPRTRCSLPQFAYCRQPVLHGSALVVVYRSSRGDGIQRVLTSG